MTEMKLLVFHEWLGHWHHYVPPSGHERILPQERQVTMVTTLPLELALTLVMDYQVGFAIKHRQRPAQMVIEYRLLSVINITPVDTELLARFDVRDVSTLMKTLMDDN